MPSRLRVTAVALSFSFLSVAAFAQIPDTYTNLEVLPANITKGELLGKMKEFTSALGVRCTHCHVGQEGQPLSAYDFASDEKEPKRTTRTMLRMVSEINSEFLAKLPQGGDGAAAAVSEVQCITCHRGFTEPKTIEQVMRATVAADGVDSAIAEYRSLRGDYFGAAGYDFRAGPLNALAAEYAQIGELATAKSLLALNAGYHPDDDRVAFLQGMVALEMTDTTTAVAAWERALSLNPQNRRVEAMLKQLKE